MRPLTVIIDVDGCVLKHSGKGASHQWSSETGMIDGVREWFDQLEREGHYIILITARKESCRVFLEYQLRECGLYYDQLIMGVTGGPRVLVNDKKPLCDRTAIGITTERNVCNTELFWQQVRQQG